MTLSRQAERLDEVLNYRLTRLIALSGAPVIRLCEGRYGISRREWRLLAHLAAQGPLSPSDLAEQIALDRARTSRAIGSLAVKGFIQRVALPGDRRRALVALNDKGQALHAELFPQVAELNRRLLQALDDGLLQSLDAMLQRLTEQAGQLNHSFATEVRADRHRGGGGRRG
ncbi:MarR family winged helix-turn-helix transcriptional regulator [Azohydromonas lata]|uniref:MarR family transcriptional regulator n=1 Tax=Azohydromonas lata TaxID=45677 RepID=A0ABU5IIK7_9BURK|nr:MarR family transcriptional regulator [Azohydromonas lata]MDZ5458490.1 MarR family transcriptional regulator [Azohydromonas lata]